jgi:hypothetical protein
MFWFTKVPSHPDATSFCALIGLNVVAHNNAQPAGDQEENLLAYLPVHLLDVAESEWRGRESGAGELLRHASAKITLDTDSQALNPQKRAAQSKVVSMIRPKARLSVPSVYLETEGGSDVTA